MPEDQDTTASPAAGEATNLEQVNQRLDRQQATLDRLAEAVARILPGSHAEAEQRTEQRLDRPSSVEEQVRAELARAQQEQADQQQAETVAQRLARLEEQPPAPQLPRRTKLLGWGDGR